MNGITVPMAVVDFIPVALFFASAVLLQRDLYSKMVKGAFALLATGSTMVLIGGIFKAGWKILYALGICDYTLLDASFFPLQGPGFLLVFLALVGMFTRYNRRHVLHSVAVVPVYTSTIPFVIMQTVGCAGAQWTLFVMAMLMKKKSAAARPCGRRSQRGAEERNRRKSEQNLTKQRWKNRWNYGMINMQAAKADRAAGTGAPRGYPIGSQADLQAGISQSN